MIAVQVADEDIIDTARLDIEAQHLLLRTFATIDQVQALVDVERLRCWISVINWSCRTTAQDRYIKPHVRKKIEELLSHFPVQPFFDLFHKDKIDRFFSFIYNGQNIIQLRYGYQPGNRICQSRQDERAFGIFT